MSRELVISKIRTYIKGSLFAGCILLSTQSVFVQDAAVRFNQKYNVSYPIQELGSCADYTECLSYCNVPGNEVSCKAFTETKGIETSTKKQIIQQDVLKKASEELSLAMQKIGESMAQSAPAGDAAPGAEAEPKKEDNIRDADFKEGEEGK